MLFFSNGRIDKDSGMLALNGRVTEGVYTFSVQVHDRVHDRDVISTVSVFVKEIGDDAVTNSGSLRLKGLSDVLLSRSGDIN